MAKGKITLAPEPAVLDLDAPEAPGPVDVQPLAPGTRKVALQDLGDNLPVGVAVPGAPVGRAVAYKAWRAKDEREIGALRDGNRSMTPGVFASEVLAHFLTCYGGQDVSGLSRPQRRLLLSRSWAGDVYAAWFNLRRMVLGNDFDMEIVCVCKRAFAYTVDLGTVDTHVVDDGAILTRAVVLQDGLEYQGRLHHVATIKPVRWDVYEAMGAGGAANLGEIKLRLAANALVGLDGVTQPGGGDLRIPWDALDLSKRDLETLVATVDQWQPGPDLSVEVGCPYCGHNNRRAIPWTYDSFFSQRASSPGSPGNG
jgi:hypothetical protein